VTAATTTKPLRSDARRNHELLVAAARELFATGGVDASVDEITKRAGVGTGTLYRHFATKEELIDAVLDDAFCEYLGLAEAALEDPDAWSGLCAFLERALALHAANHGFKDVVATRAHGLRRAAAMRRRLRPLVTLLVQRAQAQGTLRADFAPEDVSLLLWGGHGVIECSEGVAPQIWRRYLGLVLDGLRTTSPTPLERHPLSASQANRAAKCAR
jgi:AcrR family transcriptional regulator